MTVEIEVSGEGLNPDCRTSAPVASAGERNGQPWWTWIGGGHTWELFYDGCWIITPAPPQDFTHEWDGSFEPEGYVGQYAPVYGASGTAVVSSSAPPADRTPDWFWFSDVANAEPSTQYVSEKKMITGMDAGTEISVTGGEYRRNGGSWTSEPGTIDPDDTLELRGTSSANYDSLVIVAVTVGTVPVNWTIATRSVDRTPASFDFANVSDAEPSTVYVSDSQAIADMDAGTAISVSGGEYSLDGGAWTSDAGTIDPGQGVRLRATSSAESEGVVIVSVTVGTLTVEWTITTGVLSSVVSNLVGSEVLASRIVRSRIVGGWL